MEPAPRTEMPPRPAREGCPARTPWRRAPAALGGRRGHGARSGGGRCASSTGEKSRRAETEDPLRPARSSARDDNVIRIDRDDGGPQIVLERNVDDAERLGAQQ